MPRAGLLAGGACLALVACGTGGDPVRDGTPVSYDGVQTRLLDDDLVGFAVTMSGDATDDDLTLYARCAAAQYALIRGYGFARHVRTLTEERGGIRAADAVYTISAALPRGERTIDAEVTVAQCDRDGIPTV